ncbi:cytosine permease [Paenibacillus mesophilus]|uniref:cytosine permease n=1 Tax=Paenibacillus mesophilus TaxID=2582849 RepID=UPI00110E90FB|nr:cytosine permease [Paenibacillus mesophilus]TMV45469.1 cytosine permease [Paenibacillus mesophilus]
MKKGSQAEPQAQNQANDFAMEPVPMANRRPWWEITFVTSGFCMAVSGMFAGAALTAGLSLKQIMISILVGNLILALYGGFTGAIGAKTGVSTTMLSRYAFGRYGSLVISLVWAITLIGWFSVQAGFFGQTVNSMYPEAGVITRIPVAAAWGGALMILTAYIGFKGIRLLSNIAIPLLILLCIVGVVMGLDKVGGIGGLTSNITKPITLMEGIVLVIGTFAVGAVIQPDIARYAKSPKQSWTAIMIGMVIANGFIIFAGAVTAMTMGTGDLPAAMLQLGLGIPALLILIAAQWTSNDSNLYSASLSLSNIFRVAKSKLVLVVGVIATIVGAAGMANHFISFLIAIGVAVPPVAGILIADYFFVHKQGYTFGKGTKYAAVVWPAFIAWALGILAGVYVNWGIPSLNSLVVALVAHWGIYAIGKSINLAMTSGYVEEREDGF